MKLQFRSNSYLVMIIRSAKPESSESEQSLLSVQIILPGDLVNIDSDNICVEFIPFPHLDFEGVYIER